MLNYDVLPKKINKVQIYIQLQIKKNKKRRIYTTITLNHKNNIKPQK